MNNKVFLLEYKPIPKSHFIFSIDLANTSLQDFVVVIYDNENKCFWEGETDK